MRGRKDVAKMYHPAAWQRLPGQGGGPLGGTGRNTVGPPGESKGPEVRRGKIYSFSAATYTAEVFVDGSPTAVTLPVAKNLAANLLAASTKVAVLCFDPSDPEDAVVLGPYDGVPSAWITGGMIVNGAVGTTALADDAVTAAKLAHSIDATAIGFDADMVDGLHASELGGGGGVPDDDSVTGAKLSPNAVFGVSSQKLLNYVPWTSGYLLLYISLCGDSSFVAKINQPTWGTPSGSSVTYDTVTGNENSIVPQNYGGDELGKLVLHNTTRGDSAKIQAVNTTTNVITLTTNVPSDWRDNDDIRVNSLTCAWPTPPPYFFDVDLSGFLPATAHVIALIVSVYDSGGVGAVYISPYETYGTGKLSIARSQGAGLLFQDIFFLVPVVSQKICVWIDATGAATAQISIKVAGWFEEAAT
jgi:hypothetical protein